MARLSASSTGNGHPPRPEPLDETKPVPNHGDTTTNNTSDFPPRLQDRQRTYPFDASLLPSGSRSLSSIALQSLALGTTLGLCIFAALWLAFSRHDPLWRLPAFFATLSLFHFLEFWATATYNAPAARASSFLLFNNGAAYNIAHSLATAEIIISTLFFPRYQAWLVNPSTIVTGAFLVILGQVVRSVAMAQAGTNFNHTPARTKREGHVLVTSGMYGLLRHPSYFGFFWWALGTQVAVGNKVCVVGYAVALWSFFAKRIRGEEVNLVEFFGEEYEVYRRRTWTGIPFIG